MKKRRKPVHCGKAVETVAGSLRESGRGALVDGRRLGSGKLLALTRGRWKRLWRSVEAWRQVEAGRDRGRQRPDRRPRARLKTPHRGSAAHLRQLATSSRMTKGADDSVRSWRRAVKRRSTLGSDCRKAVRRRRPDGIGVNASAHRGDGHHGASRGPGSRAKYGCSCRMSVAEVGETHLPGVIKGSREASQERAG